MKLRFYEEATGRNNPLDGCIRLDETNYDKLVNFHANNGFVIITAFRSEYTKSENRKRNRELMRDITNEGYSFIKITGGYREMIDIDNPNYDNAEPVRGSDKRLLTVIEESLLIPNYDLKTKSSGNFSDLEDLAIRLGKIYEQDCVLIAPPKSGAYYVVTNPRYGSVGDVDMKFDSMSLASIADAYFSSLSKTIAKLKKKQGDEEGGMKFENRTFLGSFVDEPAHTISGKRMLDNSGQIPVFGSHYYNLSTLKG